MKPEAVLIDLGGTLHVGDTPIPGAIAAVARLRAAGVTVRGVSNTSRQTCASVRRGLRAMGFDFRDDEILTAPLAARRWLEARHFRPHLLVHENLRPEFVGIETRSPNLVLVADAAEGFTYEAMDAAFRLLMDGAPLVAIGVNRYFRNGNALSLDAGPFVKALEFAAGVEAEVLGKPARSFFRLALEDAGSAAQATVMIGDDAVNDVAGAMNAGLEALLVRTGKYRQGDEEQAANARCVADIREAVEDLLK